MNSSADRGEAEKFIERVLSTVEAIPAGRVRTYGDIAATLGVGGPRQVGQVMSNYGAAVAWWRVVRADGQPAKGHEVRALAKLRDEGTPLRGDRVDLQQARMKPDRDH